MKKFIKYYLKDYLIKIPATIAYLFIGGVYLFIKLCMETCVKNMIMLMVFFALLSACLMDPVNYLQLFVCIVLMITILAYNNFIEPYLSLLIKDTLKKLGLIITYPVQFRRKSKNYNPYMF